MEARLGVYEKAPYGTMGAADDMSTRLRVEGGHRQQERMIQAKRKSFDRALFNSYQAAEIAVPGQAGRFRALINPNITKQDYDDKILSIGYEHNLKPGDVFEWLGTNTHWLIYLQDLTELAYFKGDIRKCNYQAAWENDKGEKCSAWFAVRGPVETKINFLQKNGISLDTPNHTLNILMPKNEETIKYFKRYNKFYIGGADDLTNSICWRVEATDTISMPGVLEITAIEYYSNVIEDDVQNGIVGGLVVSPTEPEDKHNLINGETFIKPKKSYLYKYVGPQDANWYIDPKYPIEKTVKGNTIELTWTKTFSGEFVLKYGDAEKKIVVESLF